MTDTLVRGCIIGAGYMGKTHAAAYRSIPHARITAIVDGNMEKAREIASFHDGCTIYSDWRLMLEKEKPDFVDVCLPSSMHRDAVVSSLESGSHVIVEKPFALELADIDAMISASERSGKRLMVAHVCRFIPAYVYVKQAVVEGRFGRPLFYGCFRESETPMWSWNNWLLDPSTSGGTILDLSIHDIDISNWLFGKPVRFHAFEARNPLKAGPSHVVSFIGYENGGQASIEAGQLMPKGYPFSTGYRLLLERGLLEWNTGNCENGNIGVFTDGKVEKVPLDTLPPMTANDSYTEELYQFIECLIDDTPFRITPYEARLSVETVQNLKQTIQPVSLQ